jgi:3-oxoacyl-[acyl-carrier protein] reductase
VAVNYHSRPAEAEAVVREICSAGGKAAAVRADVADKAAVASMVTEAVEQLGPIDILVNNAGLLHSGDLLNYEDTELDRMWQVNVKGVLQVTAAVAPAMMERRYGRVINLSSIAALGTAFRGTTLYAATKAAVLILTKRLALELGPSGITVNAVLPGFTLTEMVAGDKTPEQVHQMTERVAEKSMLRRAGQPEDIARVISFLASDESSFMTGQFLVADGGRMDFLTHA